MVSFKQLPEIKMKSQSYKVTYVTDKKHEKNRLS